MHACVLNTECNIHISICLKSNIKPVAFKVTGVFGHERKIYTVFNSLTPVSLYCTQTHTHTHTKKKKLASVS